MKLVVLISVLCLAAIGCAKQEEKVIPADTSKADEEIIRKLSFEWIDAANQKNIKWYDSVLADDYTMVHSKGTIHTKEQEIQEVRSDTSRTDEDRLHDVKIKVYGDAAIVTSTEHIKGMQGNIPFDLQYFYTDVFIRQQGKWRVVTTQATRLPDAEN